MNDDNFTKIKAQIKVNLFLKNIIYQFNNCIKKKDKIFKRILDLISKTEYNYNNDIISQENYTSYMQKLEYILTDYNKIPFIKKNSFNIKYSYISILTSLSLLSNKLTEFEYKTGHSSIINILGKNWNQNLCNKDMNLINFLNKIFIPLEFNIINIDIIKDNKKNRIFRIVPEELDINENISIKIGNLLTTNIRHYINSAIITIAIDKKRFIIKGLIKNDPLNLQKKNGFYHTKYNNLIKEIVNLTVPSNFCKRFFDQLSLRDFIVLSQKKIIFELLNSWQDHNRYSEKNVSSLVKEFLSCNLIEQVKIITTLLISDNSKINHLAYLLYDMISTSSDTLKPKFMAEDIYKNLHWTVQKRFKKAYKKVAELRHNLRKINNIEIPYEDKILQLNASSNILRKAMEKLKEVATNKDSHKARAYLDGLLKIPFNTYKEEYIISFLKNFTEKIKNIINISRSFILNNDFQNKNSIHVIKSLTSIISDIDENTNYTFGKIENIVKNLHNFANSNNIIDKNISHDSLVNSTNLKSSKTDFDDIKNLILEIYDMWNDYIDKKKYYINDVRRILNESIFGQNDAKKEIERIVAQWINGKQDGTVLGLLGPPGTGKTTLCKKGIANCLQDKDKNSRPFAFIALGGSTNSSTLVGHSYTYQGSTWGQIVDILMETNCMNPIIYIDELDKVSKTEKGSEIIGVLTHLTDSSQNSEFSDKYFAGIKFDLSKCLIIFSYNDADLIDPILRDRITQIKINAYSKNEKVKIAQNFLLPQILETTGYAHDDITILDDDIKYVIENYTIEAGVRKLKEKLFELVRELNLKRIFDETLKLPFNINIDFIKDHFSKTTKVTYKKIAGKPYVGLVNGLYATKMGTGGITLIEVMKTPPNDTKLALELTGQQGDVMKESMQCARTVAWNILPTEIKKQIQDEWKEIGSYGLHIHCPEASTPKDGPSAGITITVGIISRLANIPIKNTIAMTGEIDLNGKVHKIGGLEYKLEGAKKAGVTEVLIPKENMDDYYNYITKLDDQDKSILLTNFEVRPVETIYEVISHSLVENEIHWN